MDSVALGRLCERRPAANIVSSGSGSQHILTKSEAYIFTKFSKNNPTMTRALGTPVAFRYLTTATLSAYLHERWPDGLSNKLIPSEWDAFVYLPFVTSAILLRELGHHQKSNIQIACMNYLNTKNLRPVSLAASTKFLPCSSSVSGLNGTVTCVALMS